MKFNIKQLTISLSAIVISVALAGCGGGDDAGGKNEANKSAAYKTSQKGSGNEKPEPKLPKDTFGGERNSIAGSTPTKESGNEKQLPKPPKDSLAAFLWGKKIVFKKVGSSQAQNQSR